MKRKIIHLSYYFKHKQDKKFDNLYVYCKNLFYSNSYLIDLYSYRHLFFALNIAELIDNKKILDLGCADGPFLPTLNRNGSIIIGLDFLLDWLLKAKDLKDSKENSLERVILVNAESHYLPFKNNSIDLIFCLETLEHIPNSISLINEIYRVLKEGGELIYSVPNEIGFSLLIRQLIGKFTGFERENYSVKELFRNGILKRPSKRINNPITHKNFDWKKIQHLINIKFRQLKITYSPFPFLKKLNPTIIFKVQKI